MTAGRGRPKKPTTAPIRWIVGFCLLDLLTESVVIDYPSKQAELIAAGHDPRRVLKNIRPRKRVRIQGAQTTSLPKGSAYRIMAALSGVPTDDRVIRGRLSPGVEKIVRDLTRNYPVRAQGLIREACIRIAPLVPGGLSEANVKKLHREWCAERPPMLGKRRI